MLPTIMQYVGDRQYRFVAAVNRTFYQAYTTVHFHQSTDYTVSTLEHAKLCYGEIPCERKGRFLCRLAAQHGKLDILQWLRENGCFWDGETCANAAKGGHLDLLKWCRAKGWNKFFRMNSCYKTSCNIWVLINFCTLRPSIETSTTSIRRFILAELRIIMLLH
jgi:hypothetical protein